MHAARFAALCLVMLVGTAGSATQAEEFSLPSDAPLEELWNAGEFTEGVAVRADGVVFFSDIPRSADDNGRILQFDPATGNTTVFCKDSRQSNGLFFTDDGRLLACCGANGGAMALCEITAEGEVRPLAERFHGKRFNSPNDLVVHPGGAVYFSDPRYVGPEPLELDHQSVFRFEPQTGSVTRVTTDIEKPNGLQVSPDGGTLYVAETNNGSTGQPGEPAGEPGRMTLNAFDIAADGSLSNKRVLVDFGDQLGTDGMAVDPAGRIFAAVRSEGDFGIDIFSPARNKLARIATPTLPTNCCFGVGETHTVLYVTAGGGLYRVDLAD